MVDGASSVRLFAAVNFDETVRRAVTTTTAAIAERLVAAGGARVSWVRPWNLHVTVRFLGDVEVGVMRRLRTSWVRPWLAGMFDLKLAAPGTFPPSGTPRVMWVGVCDRSSGFDPLTLELDERLRTAGVGENQVRFVPHVTVGRVRRAAAAACGRMIREALEAVKVKAVRWRATDVILYESRVTPSGPSYVPQAVGALRAGITS